MVQIEDNRVTEELYDIIILGGGVAGLSAAMTAGRLGLRVLVLEKAVFGGSVAVLETVTEYPGVAKVGGWELTQTMVRQAEDAGCVLIDSIDAVDLMELEGGTFRIKSSEAYEFWGRSVIITTGGQPKPLGLENEELFAQRGIHTCAQCAGPRYKGKEVVIAGNGSWAVEAALHLLSMECRVSFITGDAKMAGNVFLIDKLMCHEGFQFMAGWHIEKLYGTEYLEEIDLVNLKSGKMKRKKVAAVFIYRSIVPNINIVPARQNAKGFPLLNEDRMTSLPGVFAAGRVADHKLPVQVIVGDGSRAALSAAAWLQADTRKT